MDGGAKTVVRQTQLHCSFVRRSGDLGETGGEREINGFCMWAERRMNSVTRKGRGMRGRREVKGVLAKRVICFVVVVNSIWSVVIFFRGGGTGCHAGVRLRSSRDNGFLLRPAVKFLRLLTPPFLSLSFFSLRPPPPKKE